MAESAFGGDESSAGSSADKREEELDLDLSVIALQDTDSFGEPIKNYTNIGLGNRVLKLQLEPGIGVLVPDESFVYINYVVEKSNLPENLDKLYKNLPNKFVMGSGEMLKELETGIKTMKFGECSRFIINPEPANSDATIQYKISHILYVRLLRFEDMYEDMNEDIFEDMFEDML